MYKRGISGIAVIVIIVLVVIIGLAVYTLRPRSPITTETPTATTTDGGFDLSDLASTTSATTKTYRRSYETGFEGKNVKVTYELTYPAPAFEITSSDETPSTITIREQASSQTHTVMIFNNGAAGFMNSREVWQGAGVSSFCPGCKETPTTLTVRGGSDVVTWASADKEVIIWKRDPGFVIAKLFKPTSSVAKVLSTLTVTATDPKASDASATTMPVTLYFQNESISPTTNDCEAVVEVTRQVPKTTSPGTAALNALLAGPTTAEKADGFKSTLPIGSKLNSLRITEGTAYADFNATTDAGGGACTMTARTAQIRQTLLQFPSVKRVVLSAGGKAADESFQP